MQASTALESRRSQRFRPEELFTFSTRVLQWLDVPPADAAEVAECLILADLRGVDSHGLIRLPVYARRLQHKAVKARPTITTRSQHGAVALVDGDNGLGPVVGARAMAVALSLAENSGIGFVGVRRSNHFGAAAFYVQKAIHRRYIGIATSNAPPNMAAFGGKQRFLGTNPIGIGIPAGKEEPLIFDASASVAARGKIIAAAQKNASIPEGWAIDPDGRPTTDPHKALAGAVLPFGGPKGSAISFIVDILCGVLTGASFALQISRLENLRAEQDLGHVFAALRTDLFLSATEFADRMDEILRMLRAAPPAPGVPRVLAPGELEFAAEGRNRQHGIPLADEVVTQLVELGKEAGVELPRSSVAVDS